MSWSKTVKITWHDEDGPRQNSDLQFALERGLTELGFEPESVEIVDEHP